MKRWEFIDRLKTGGAAAAFGPRTPSLWRAARNDSKSGNRSSALKETGLGGALFRIPLWMVRPSSPTNGLRPVAIS